MRKVGLFLLTVAVVAGALAPSATHAQSTPTITFAAADTTAWLLSIRGSSLGAAPKAYLGTLTGKLKPLFLVKKSATSITARLSSITPGSYRLVVANGNLRGAATVTIGATGQQGPAGPQGRPGFVGYPCWDENASGVCEPGTEDLNKDGVCNVGDCPRPVLRIGASYTDRNLVGSDFSHMVLGGSTFSSDLRFANFTHADLTASRVGEILAFADFSNANLYFATILSPTAANFSNANLSHATVRGDVRAADFANANLSYATVEDDVRGSNFSNADLSFAAVYGYCRGAIFSNANMPHATVGGDFTGAVFSNANMPDATISGDFTAANFEGATVTNAKYSSWTICPDGQRATDLGNDTYTCAGRGGGL